MHLFYTPDIQCQHLSFVLNEEESKHAIRVLRMVRGDGVRLVDGRGGWYEATIVDAHPKRTVLDIINLWQEDSPRPHYLHMAVAPTKNIERLEWFLEKATEVGIDEVTPLICDRSERRDVKLDRLSKVMVSAMKQSLKAHLPVLNPPVAYRTFVDAAFVGKRFIAHCADGPKQFLSGALSRGERVLVLIGPEGDFSEPEIAAALQAGYTAISLGDARLRTETAALVACLEVAVLNR